MLYNLFELQIGQIRRGRVAHGRPLLGGGAGHIVHRVFDGREQETDQGCAALSCRVRVHIHK